MPETLDYMSDSPVEMDVHAFGVDVMGEVLDAAHLTTALYGRLDLGAPWQLRIPARPYFSFYVVMRGGGWIELETADGTSAGDAIPLSAGDAVLLLHGSAHRLRDSVHTEVPPMELDYGTCPRPFVGEVARFGGDGPSTSLVTGHFSFGAGAVRNPLLVTLPPLIHLPAHAVAASPQLGGVVPLILNESAQPGPGAGIVLARLADLLLIHALRYWISTARPEDCGLHAVVNPGIGAALRLMHARAGEPWTVERLASAVSMSRSAFAARFTQLVGEPPLQYLARWRMTLAGRLLANSDLGVGAVAEHVGYANPVAFAKAFARFQGVGPGGYRRAHRVRQQ